MNWIQSLLATLLSVMTALFSYLYWKYRELIKTNRVKKMEELSKEVSDKLKEQDEAIDSMSIDDIIERRNKRAGKDNK